MVKVIFTENIQRHVPCPPTQVEGLTVQEVLDAVFTVNPRARSYVLYEQGQLRKHMTVFVNGEAIRDRDGLTDLVPADAELYIMQALSGG